ncbi:hypothetical protein ACOSP7_007505 [Xanthoceras sorbifolium]
MRSARESKRAPASSGKKKEQDDDKNKKIKKSPDQSVAESSRANKKPCTGKSLFGLSNNIGVLSGGNKLPAPNNPVDDAAATDQSDHISKLSTKYSAAGAKQETPKSTFRVVSELVRGSDKATTPKSQTTISTTHDDKKHAKKKSIQETKEALGQKPNYKSGQGSDITKSTSAKNKARPQKSGTTSEPKRIFEVNVFPQIIIKKGNNASEKKENTKKKQPLSDKTTHGLFAPK